MGLSVTVLDRTVVFLALPAIERDLGIGLAGQQWVVNSYLVALSSLLLVGGSLGDRYGRRRVFLVGLAGFGAASLAAGLAPGLVWLLAARVAQGVFGALLMPATLALLIARYSGEGRAAAIGAWAAWSGIATAAGPLVAGALITTLSWRWIFFLSLPLVAAAGALAWWGVEESRDEGDRQPLDWPGAVLAVLTVGAIAYVAVQGPEAGWTDPGVLVAAAVVPLALAGFLLREARTPRPMLPLSLFRSRDLSAANGSTLTLYAAFSGGFFLLTIYLQSVLGYSALAAGAATLPVTLVMVLLSRAAGRLGERVGPRLPMTAGQLVVAAGLIWLSFVQPGAGYWAHILPGVLVYGLGIALTVAPLTTTAVTTAADAQAGIASGVNNAAARLAGLLGVALVGLVFALTFRGTLQPPEGASPAERAAVVRAEQRPTSALEQRLEPAVVDEVRGASEAAYGMAMQAVAGLAVAGAAIAWLGLTPRSARKRPG